MLETMTASSPSPPEAGFSDYSNSREFAGSADSADSAGLGEVPDFSDFRNFGDLTGADPAAAASPPVQLEGVSKHFGRGRGRVTALDAVSLAFPAGSFTAVLGASGSGKSTLLQCAAGLERPSAGKVRLCGTDLSTLSNRRQTVMRRDRVGFVFQELNLMPELTVGANIALPLRLGRRRVKREAIAEAAARVGLNAAQLKRLPSQLSGGQQQRAAIARALVIQPEVIFADEPTGALDPFTAQSVLQLLRQTADGATVVIVTHDPQVVRFCDRAVFLYAGRVEAIVASPEPGDVAARLHALGSRAVGGSGDNISGSGSGSGSGNNISGSGSGDGNGGGGGA
jgi:putative ABC transport system ATP-binding protein